MRPRQIALLTTGRAWIELVGALALACLYVAVANGHLSSIDGLLMYRQATSIAYHHSLHLSPPVWWGSEFSNSKYGIGLSLLYVPGLLAGFAMRSWIPAQAGESYDVHLYYADHLYKLIGPALHVLVAALTAYLVGRFIRELGFSSRAALFGMALFGVASPAIVYSRGDTAEMVTALCWMAALFGALRFRYTAGRRYLVLTAVTIAYGVLTRPVEGTLVVPAVALLALSSVRPREWHRRDREALLGAIIGLAVGGGATLLVNWARYGSPLTTGYGHEGWTTPLPIGLAGALISPGRGLLLAFPAIVLVPLGVRHLWRTGRERAAIALALPALLQLLNVATWDDWWGGWAWGLRLFVPALPIVAILAAVGFAGRRSSVWNWVAGVAFALGVVWTMPALLTDILGGYGQRYDGSAASFALTAYPPIGAWRFLHHWRALAATDTSAADVVWLRLARGTHNLSLLPPLLFGGMAVILGRRLWLSSGDEPLDDMA